MMKFLFRLVSALVASLVAPSVCLAGVVTSAASVTGPTTVSGFGWENTIDQSGLSPGYLSGVTDFDSYVGNSPAHLGVLSPGNFAASFDLPPVNIDFDLGFTTSVTDLALWNYPFGDSGGIIDFEVFTARSADFSDSELVGTFTALDDGSISLGNVQVFELLETTARYVRIGVLTRASENGTGLSEVAFGTSGLVLDFDEEDDFMTPLSNGQAVSAPLAFGDLVSITASGNNNFGAAIFDSDPNGPNGGSSDPDLLVDLGNILILQGTSFQSVPGFFDDPDDAAVGGTLIFDFVGPVGLRSVDLIDICPGPGNQDLTVTLSDGQSRMRTFVVPSGWTNDIAMGGAPGFGTLDLSSLLPQPGFVATATASEDTAFDPSNVIRMEVRLMGSGGLDNLRFAPQVQPVLPSGKRKGDTYSAQF